jgi:hypothetical protein
MVQKMIKKKQNGLLIKQVVDARRKRLQGQFEENQRLGPKEKHLILCDLITKIF